jgi:cell division cycle 14
MEHVEMYFDDGTNPSDRIVRDFIRLAEEVIERRKQKVAVHCKAGLGRTGVLIGGGPTS